MKTTRRKFLQIAGLSLAALPLAGKEHFFLNNPISQTHKSDSISLGLASYTTREFSLEKTLEMMNKLGLKKLSAKSMHLPLESTEEQINDALKKIQQANIELFTVGVIYVSKEQDVENAFLYAQRAKVKLIVGVPNHELLPMVEKKVKETGIQFAIHNHGPEDKLYPTPQSVYEKIANLDSRIGMCLDIGHTQRSNVDPSDALKKYFSRIMDIHFKDTTLATIDGKTIEMGRGIIDLAKFVKTIKKLKYAGHLTLEYEKDGSEPWVGLAESIGYTKGLFDAL